jgi:hypothetical protein
MHFIFLAFISFIPFTQKHDFHVSTTYGVFEKNNLQLTAKVFTDDLEQVLEKEHGLRLNLGGEKEAPQARALVKAYLINHFRLKADAREALKPNFVGFEVELDITYLYFEYGFNKKPLKLNLENTILLNAFSDQTNLVNIKDGERMYSLIFNGENPMQTLKFKR